MKLVSEVGRLKNQSAGRRIRRRMKEFLYKGRGSREEIFNELAFCILTANFSSEGGLRVQNKIGSGFLDMDESELAIALRNAGYRFPNVRAGYIAKAREHLEGLMQVLRGPMAECEKREWLAKTVPGLGCKEASHFLRNVGHSNLAIIDFHIVDLLARHGTIKRVRTMTSRRYLEIEAVLKGIAQQCNMSPGELDLYLWYMETGKILK
ncbi:N-glycosylase/DNA lyase [Candidatus Micrarchaeota archaeon]|nr:N-glycosylase/DNA lyase [Candidatus Micrarchaeota archaeon]